MRYLKRSQPVCYLFCLKIKYAITDRFTKENAINAPKFITEAINSKPGPIANSETAPVKTIVNTRVRNFGWSYPNNFRGRIHFRPITKRHRDTLACDTSPEAAVGADAPPTKMH